MKDQSQIIESNHDTNILQRIQDNEVIGNGRKVRV